MDPGPLSILVLFFFQVCRAYWVGRTYMLGKIGIIEMTFQDYCVSLKENLNLGSHILSISVAIICLTTTFNSYNLSIFALLKRKRSS